MKYVFYLLSVNDLSWSEKAATVEVDGCVKLSCAKIEM